MRYQFKFGEKNIRTVCEALCEAALWCAEGLEELPAGSYDENRDLIDEWRGIVSEYMGLRRQIMKCQAMTQSEEDAKQTMEEETRDLEIVIEQWNTQIRRIRQEENKDKTGGKRKQRRTRWRAALK